MERPTHNQLAAVAARKRILEGIWLLILVAALVALAVPWYLRILDFDLAPIAWGSFAMAVVFLAVALATDRSRSRRTLLFTTTAQQLLGILFLAVIWRLSGGIENPLFLLIFCLPVVAAAAAPARRQVFVVALLALLAVGAVAWAESPALRRYALQLGLPVGALAAVTSELSPAVETGFEQPPARIFLGLSSFAVLLLALAASAEALANHGRGRKTTERETTVAPLALAAFVEAPEPTAVVDPRSGLVVAASHSFSDRLLLDAGDLARRSIFELAGFDHPPAVEALLTAGVPGEVRVVCRIGPEERLTRVVTYGVEDGDSRHVVLRLEDVSSAAALETAIADLEDPVIVIAADDRLVYGNRAAEALLGDLYRGLPAAETLAAEDAEGSWWRLDGRRASHGRVTLEGRDLEWRAAAAGSGRAPRFTVLRLWQRS